MSDHVFLMDGVKVAEVFGPLMARNFQMLQEDWPATIKPVTGADFDIGSVARWYLHQANGVVVRQAAQMLGLPPRAGPDWCRPLREHLRRQHPDPAGRAMNGYAAMVL